ncbi:MAG: GAF domain-containing protein [Nitrospirae bacterium]|nr:GAF domain-containing protein [Nitrospirota bacterium]MBF0591358.1 GAF domain-containing protein [Nitrospirota bacterium]
MIKKLYLSIRETFRFNFNLRIFLSFGALIIVTVLSLLSTYLFGLPYTKIEGIYKKNLHQMQDNMKTFADMEKRYMLKWIQGCRGDARVISDAIQTKDNLEGLILKIQQYNKSIDTKSFTERLRQEKEYKALASYINSVQSSNYGDYEEISIVDTTSGTIIVSTQEDEVGSPAVIYEQSIKSEDEWFSLVVSNQSGNVNLVIFRPVYLCAETNEHCDRRFILQMNANIKDILSSVLSAAEGLGKTTEVLLADKDARTLIPLRFQLPDKSVPRILEYKLDTVQAKLAATGNEGLMESTDYRGEPVMVVFRHILITPEMGIGLIVKVDEKELMAPVMGTIVIAIWLMVLGLVLLLVSTFLVLQKISNPVIEIIKAVENIKAGDLSIRVPVNVSGDLGILVHTFNEMLTGIEYQQRATETERDKLKAIMEAMQDGIYITNREHDIEFVNRAILKEFGEVNGRKCYEYFHDRTGQCQWCKIDEVLSGKSITWEWDCPKNHKTYSHLDTPIGNMGGSVSKFAILHDVSDIKNAQLLLKRELDFQTAVAELSEALLSSEKDIVDISIIVKKQAMRLTDSLHCFVAEIDRETGDEVGHTLTDMMRDGQCSVDTRQVRLVFPKGKDGYNALWGHALNTRQGFYTNDPQGHPAYKGCIPEGHIQLTRYLSVPAIIKDRLIGHIHLANAQRDYKDADLDVIKRLATIYALAVDRKRMEEELRYLNVNLASIVKEETTKRQMQEQMLIQQSKMAAMGEVIGLIAHQWKQPLNAIGITVQDLEDAYKFGEVSDTYIAHTVDVTMGQVNFLGKTIDTFRDFFKPSRQKVQFDVKDAIDELISMFIAIFIKSAISVNLKTNQAMRLITDGYPNEFKQVILNILNNAKDAIISRRKTDANIQGKIDVEITNDAANEQIIVSIRDNGGGIPIDIIDRIFEPYYTTKGSEGTGIGLYMSKTIIETNMGGRFTVKNIDGGAEFTIVLSSCDIL